MKKILVAVVGPTAVGKTKASISIASHFNTEIISADARQFYKEMNIGTAKPSVAEMQQVPHHFISHLSVRDDYSAGDFEKEALAKLEELFLHQDVVVVTGGSGLFVRALLQGLDVFPGVSEHVIADLDRLYKSEGIQALQKLLKEKDPGYYEVVDRNNTQRLLRALAVCMSSGQPYSTFRKAKPAYRTFVPLLIGLELERKELYHQINERVDRMMQEGFLEEVKTLQSFAQLNPLQTVGYQELFDHIDGKLSLKDAIDLIKQHTRNYAKRQLTWFRKEKDIVWFHPDQVREMIGFIEGKLGR
ncbi:MAG TPA: tRNA (adenosine(37)-N6)-dimethylallyltransferase MiaA [Chitinophagales bacterium]|nr:tRNA (adenosine(37)-N6)-dimethylallyltransferase MiaA [Chitinophagales bacterium]